MTGREYRREHCNHLLNRQRLDPVVSSALLVSKQSEHTKCWSWQETPTPRYSKQRLQCLFLSAPSISPDGVWCSSLSSSYRDNLSTPCNARTASRADGRPNPFFVSSSLMHAKASSTCRSVVSVRVVAKLRINVVLKVAAFTVFPGTNILVKNGSLIRQQFSPFVAFDNSVLSFRK